MNPMQVMSMIQSGKVNPQQLMGLFGNNPQVAQMMQLLQGGANPQQIISQMQGNPLMAQAQKMIEGKNPQQINAVLENVAKQKGMDLNQIKQMAQMFGVKL